MTVYYRGPDARITHEVFESCRPHHRSFLIRELEYVHTVRPDAVIAMAASTPVRVCSAGASGIAVSVAAVGWPLGLPTVTGVGLAAVGGCAALMTVARLARRQPLELRAVYRGALVCLFSTTDRTTLRQITRALLRVLERIEDGR